MSDLFQLNERAALHLLQTGTEGRGTGEGRALGRVRGERERIGRRGWRFRRRGSRKGDNYWDRGVGEIRKLIVS